MSTHSLSAVLSLAATRKIPLLRRSRPASSPFGGTFSAIGGIRPAPRFDFELVDDVIGRRISHRYDVLSLPIAS
jgi:hypothetical protein